MEPTDQELRERHYRERGRRVSAAMRAKAERGVLPGCAPLGYRNAVVDGARVIVIDPETAPKVRRLFELATRKKMSLRKLADEAVKMGLRSRNGKRLSAPAAKILLTNPFYLGYIRYGNKIEEGQHQGIVSKKQFNAAIGALAFRGKSKPQA